MMKAWRGLFAGLILVMCAGKVFAQNVPVLGSIKAAYANLQSSVKIAGMQWGPGVTSYGPVGTPLVLTGTNFGSSGTVRFVPYKNGTVDTSATAAVATVTLWSSNTLVFKVPQGALSGLIEVTSAGATSNGLPFLVTPGMYLTSCPSPPNPVAPVITWATPAAISFGTALSGTQLNASANVAGTFVYSPAAGAIMLAGTDTLSATFTPTDTTDYVTVTASVPLLVNPGSSTITCWQ
jgi:hypothetical protein